ncbi:hypothetical protein AB0K04_08260 [Micromonospora coxensis]|uniref:hypothetical protein n=1 Tax=Micromonospora coxensis TaxID=356852 RepID=UPI003446AF7C
MEQGFPVRAERRSWTPRQLCAVHGDRIGILGRIELSVDGVAVSLAPLERAFVASLAAHHGRIVFVDRLIDGLWPSDPPTGARHRVRAIGAPVRRSATPELIVTRLPADRRGGRGRDGVRHRRAGRCHRHRRPPCRGTARPGTRALARRWRNVFLVGCAVAGLFAPAGPARPGEAVLAVAGGLVVMLDELRHLFRRVRTVGHRSAGLGALTGSDRDGRWRGA